MQVQQELEGYAARGARVVAIGQGSGDEAAHYCAKWGATLPCLGDPERRAYAQLDLLRGSWWTVVGRALLTQPVRTVSLILQADFAGAMLAGSDPLQLGGVAIFDADGRLRFLHVARATDDIPSNAEVFEALDALAV